VQGAGRALQLKSPFAVQRTTTPQRPPAQGSPLQQSLDCTQICPKSAQVPASGAGGGVAASGVVPASVAGGVPASAGGVTPPQGPHTPLVDPGATEHDVPGQQSALVVHEPQAATHCCPAHTKGAPVPVVFGTQGRPPQQLALDAHAWPAPTHAPVQRGTPTLSCLHVSSVSQLPLQQSHDELHDIVLSLQTSPSGLQPIGLRHTPTDPPALLSQVTGLPDPPGRPEAPQQSVSLVQRSPTTWHPLAGWQTKTPVGPQGAQARLQHGPPHSGRPASLVAEPASATPPQIIPSVRPQFAAPPGAAVAQVPRREPEARVQLPAQQSASVEQASPPWMQKDDAWHVPPVHRLEQQSPFVEQAFPSVAQLVLSAWHVPPVHCWLQQAALPVQLAPSPAHAG
jgi:hypothetical protein